MVIVRITLLNQSIKASHLDFGPYSDQSRRSLKPAQIARGHQLTTSILYQFVSVSDLQPLLVQIWTERALDLGRGYPRFQQIGTATIAGKSRRKSAVITRWISSAETLQLN